jgi:hypothetical protein
MSKERNGVITKCLAIAGVLALLAGWIWNAATMSSALNANLKADEATHPKVQPILKRMRQPTRKYSKTGKTF